MLLRAMMLSLSVLAAASCISAPDSHLPTAVEWGGIDVGTSGPVGCTPVGDALRDAQARKIDSTVKSANAVMSTQNCAGTVDLVCAPAIADWGEWVTCQILIEPSNLAAMAGVRRWSFEGANGTYTPPYSNFFTWEGPMVESGNISADIDVDDGVSVVSAFVYVHPRPASAWGSQVTTGPAVGTQIDHCVDANEIGLTANVGCTLTTAHRLFSPAYANGTFHDPEEITYGPNTGLWYVGNPSASMHLRKVLRRDLRADGLAMPIATNSHTSVLTGCGTSTPRNIHYVNTVCAPNATMFMGFSDLVTANNAHEQNHLSLAFTAAQQTSGDLKRLLRPLVRRGQAALEIAAEIQHTSAHGYVSQQAMFHTGTASLFTIFAPSPGTYAWTTISVPLQN